MASAKLLPEKLSKLSKHEDAKHLPPPYKLRRYYTPEEVSAHNTPNDCWVSFFNEVYDLTQLVQKNYGAEVEPITKAAGTDISHWFDAKTRDPKVVVRENGAVQYFTPNGRYLHVPPAAPDAQWNNSFGTP
eukprot:TRINITY_DN4111_c0_g3_i3.p3 TRINITY_DN4111_c0_g3~~TRINITY_DN4111_c0_g3_i3.p3  ORF type:complete len:131 (-),score=46.90 TRINITY_DN4111_c0_g3_i3:504-896(-)